MTTDMAVIVGATGALGRAIAARLAGAGLRILAVSRTAQSHDDLKSWNPAITTCVADIAYNDSIARIAAAVSGPVRMVVHGPGLTAAGDVLTIPTQALSDSVNIKAGGMLRLVRAVDVHVQPHSRLVAIGGHYGLEPSADTAAAAGRQRGTAQSHAPAKPGLRTTWYHRALYCSWSRRNRTATPCSRRTRGARRR